jgi:hypothetical protein
MRKRNADRQIMFLAAITFVTILFSAPVLALNLECLSFESLGGGIERPIQPTCAVRLYPPLRSDRYGFYDFQLDVDRCRSEIESFRYKMNEYLSCLKSEGDEAISVYNDLVRRFNIRARGG